MFKKGWTRQIFYPKWLLVVKAALESWGGTTIPEALVTHFQAYPYMENPTKAFLACAIPSNGDKRPEGCRADPWLSSVCSIDHARKVLLDEISFMGNSDLERFAFDMALVGYNRDTGRFERAPTVRKKKLGILG